MTPFRVVAASIALVAIAGCTVNAAVPPVTPGTVNAVQQVLAQYASLGLKMLDDAGVETNLDRELIQTMLVGGKEQQAEFDADGNLKVPTTDAEQVVEVRLKDGQTVQVPVKAKQNGKLTAFVMAGSKDGELIAEVGTAGQKPQDIFKDKTVRFEVGDPQLTDQTARAFFIGKFKVPRQSWFVADGDLRLHGSTLFIIAQAGNATMPPPMPPKTFGLLQAPPPPQQPKPPLPGGNPPPQQPGQPGQPMPGQPMPPQQQPVAGAQPQPVVFRVVAEIGGKWTAWTFTPKAGVRLPGPPLPAGPGLLPKFDELPTLKKADFDLKAEDIASLADFESKVVVAQRGTFLPPAPPPRPAQR